MNIRKIIKEELEKVLNKKESEVKFDQDIVYLNGFILTKKENKSDVTIWVFEHKTKDYTIRFYLKKTNSSDSWLAKIFIYWKTASRDFTNAKGKDYEHTFGPFSSYDEMILELNKKLENNPLISKNNYLDDNRTQFDNDILEMLKLLKKKRDKLFSIKDKHFNDLKIIYNETRKINTIDGLVKYIDEKAHDEDDKQYFLLTLQKIFQINFYMHKEQTEALF